jgi:hypothetical protein
MTIPLGFVADRYGARTVLWMNLVPRICILAWAVTVGYIEHLLPTKAILVAPMLSILGGDCVFNSIVYVLASDMTEDRTVRYVPVIHVPSLILTSSSATYYAYIGSTSYVVALLGPALASMTMSALLWLPFYIGIVLLLAAAVVIGALPTHKDSGSARDDSEPLLSSPLLKAQDQPSLVASISYRFIGMKAALSSHPRNFTLLLASFFLTSLASSDTKLLVQYISKRYHWTFASAGYLLSGKAVVNFVLLTVVIPRLLKRVVTSTHWSPDGIYLLSAKVCIGISVVGALAIASADSMVLLVPSLLIYALGSALPVFTMSLLKSPLVTSPEVSSSGTDGRETQVFSIVMLIKTLGSLVGAPLMAGAWMRGIGAGGLGLGLPYFVSAGCYVLAMVVVAGMRMR